MTTFTHSFNQQYSNIGLMSALRDAAERMYLNPKVKAHYSIVTITVECDTPHERKLLENLAKTYERVSV